MHIPFLLSGLMTYYYFTTWHVFFIFSFLFCFCFCFLYCFFFVFVLFYFVLFCFFDALRLDQRCYCWTSSNYRQRKHKWLENWVNDVIIFVRFCLIVLLWHFQSLDYFNSHTIENVTATQKMQKSSLTSCGIFNAFLMHITTIKFFNGRPTFKHRYTRFSHYRVAPGDRIRRPEQPNWKRG